MCVATVVRLLVKDDVVIVQKRVPDDVYIHGIEDFLRILQDGNILFPLESFTKALIHRKHVNPKLEIPTR